jgi:hypothetical protein
LVEVAVEDAAAGAGGLLGDGQLRVEIGEIIESGAAGGRTDSWSFYQDDPGASM